MNITELKEKLIVFNMEEFINFRHDYRTEHSIFPDSEESAKYQLNKDAKTITALLSIIEQMQKKFKEIYADGSYKDIASEIALETLTATEQKLKELGEG